MPIELSPDLIATYGQFILNIVIFILLGLIAYWLLRRGIATLTTKQYLSESLQTVLQGITRWIVTALVVLLILQQFGVPLTSVWAGLSAGVVLIGAGLVAVWSVLSNVLCSLLLLMFRPFQIGDRIEIIEATGGNGLKGTVINLNPIYTFIQEEQAAPEDGNPPSGEPPTLYVPNNIFFQKTIRRWRGDETEQLEEYLLHRSDRPEAEPIGANGR